MEPFTVVRVLGQAIDCAIKLNASDIHITSIDGALKIDYRVAREIRPYVFLTSHAQEFIRRIKALARMDVTDQNGLQEGMFHWQTGETMARIRVSVVPLVSGESVVLRLMYPVSERFALHEIGLTPEQYWSLTSCLHADHGLILVAGRTGVGKTTTLYAMMQYLAEKNRQVFSIEDPVEVPLPSVRQIEVRERFGVTYETSLRALLRQDLDVLMIGEIRDTLTAHAALRAALTGRLVLATTHAKDTRQVVLRLAELGISPELLHEVLRLVMIQETVDNETPRNKHAFVLDTHFAGVRDDVAQFGEEQGRDWIGRRSM